MSIDPDNEYTRMQKAYYAQHAHTWNKQHRADPGFVRFASQNAWPEYEYLFKGFNLADKDKIALDFGCGPGRNSVLYADRFRYIDGVDLQPTLLLNADLWVRHNGVRHPDQKFWLCNGVDLANIPSDKYDIVMSTICLQHICVHQIRFDLLSEFFRVLKSGGWITIQMAFNANGPGDFAGYFENRWDAKSTNGGLDVEICDPQDVKKDLSLTGFVGFTYDIRPGGNIGHKNAIFFKAQKP